MLEYSTDLPEWLTFTVISNSTAKLSGTLSKAGIYSVSLVAIEIDYFVNLAFAIQITEPVGISSNADLFTIYPNPANNYIKISGAEQTTIKLINSTRSVILMRNIYSDNEMINISELQSELYIVSIIYDNKVTN